MRARTFSTNISYREDLQDESSSLQSTAAASALPCSHLASILKPFQSAQPNLLRNSVMRAAHLSLLALLLLPVAEGGRSAARQDALEAAEGDLQSRKEGEADGFGPFSSPSPPPRPRPAPQPPAGAGCEAYRMNDATKKNLNRASRISLDCHPCVGSSPLLVAAKKGYVEMVKELLAARAPVDQADNFGQTPLLLAASEGKSKVIQPLLAYGADVNAQDHEGLGPSSPIYCSMRRLRSARASGSRPLVRDLVVLSNHHAVYQELPWVEVRITKDNGLNNGTATLDGHRHHGIPSAMGRTSNPRPVARRNRRTRDRLSFRSRRWKSPTSPALLRQDVLRMLWQWVESGTEKSDLAKSVQKMAFARLRKGEGEKEALEGKLVELQMKENFMERTLPLLVQDQSQSRGHAGATASEG
eukprot:s5040_g8.t1